MYIHFAVFGRFVLNRGKLIIYDKDEKYAANLMEYLSTIKDFPYDISVFSKQDALVEYGGHTRIDLLLASESAYF